MRPTMILQIETAFKDKPDHLGVKVGILCIRAGVPLSFVEGVMGSNAVSVRRWVTGVTKPQHKMDLRKLTRLIYTLERAINEGVLPSESKFDPQVLLPIWQASKAVVQ